MQICRICLAMDTKLYNLQGNNLNTLYEQLTGINVNIKDRLPQVLCWECTYRLITACQFKNKAMTCYNVMMDIIRKHSYLTQDSIKSVDRHTNNLTSTLVHKMYETNQSNLHVHDTSLNIDYTQKYCDSKIELELKVENESTDDESNDINVDIIRSTESRNTVKLYVKEELNIENKRIKTKSKRCKKNVNDVKRCKKNVNDLKRCQKNVSDEKICKTVEKDLKIDRRRRPASEVLNEEIFTIQDLSLEEKLSEIRKRQDSSNYQKAEFKCLDCFKGFLDKNAYNAHLIRHAEQSGAHQCDICKIRFKKRHGLRNHEFQVHLQKFCCKRCPYVTTRRHAAKLHEVYHSGTRYQCPHCPEDFGKFSTYMGHIRIKHPSDFVCPLCGNSFVSAKGIMLHTKLKHKFDEQTVPVDGPYCELCDVRFMSMEALTRHLKLSDKHNKIIKNNRMVRKERDPGKSSKEKKEEARNRRRNKIEDPIPCEQCGMKLPNSLIYYRHFKRMHPDKNRTNYPSMKTKCMCEVCGKIFQSLAMLHDHGFTHLDCKQFQCEKCDKTFQTKSRLIAHNRVHLVAASRGSHACGVCDKRFTTAGNLQRHAVYHTWQSDGDYGESTSAVASQSARRSRPVSASLCED